MSSTASSLGKTSSVKGKRYSYLPLLAPPVMVSRSAAAFRHTLSIVVTAPLCQTTSPRHGRTLRQSKGATTGSGLRLYMKDGLLQACALVVTQGDNSRIRWSGTQERQHVLSEISDPTSRFRDGTLDLRTYSRPAPPPTQRLVKKSKCHIQSSKVNPVKSYAKWRKDA
jgi:hypothetical protein